MNTATATATATATTTTTTTTDTTFLVLRDEWDEDGIEITTTAEEFAALTSWYGVNRTVYMPDLGQPTFSEFGESKASAFQAALAALERATAHPTD